MAVEDSVDQAEVWCEIEGFEGYYSVSNLGRVKSLQRSVWVNPSSQAPCGYLRRIRERVLRPGVSGDGRHSVTLWKEHEYKICGVHALVMSAFVGPLPVGMERCHNDGDPANNALSNLRYDTAVNNSADKRKHGTHLQGSMLSWAKLDESDIHEIRKAYADGETQQEIADRYGVQQPAVSRVLSGKRWSHVTAEAA